MRPFLALMLCMSLPADAAEPRGGTAGVRLRRYDTPYYVIHTDLAPEAAGEAVVRMSRLGDELRRRTRQLRFNGRIEQRLPFYLYARHADYVAATGEPPESAGVFRGDRLVAAAADARGGQAWHVVQHEAFHQFAHATTGTELPAWLDEGLGEYFGEALFTGDGYVTGVIPDWRLKRIKRLLREDTFAPLDTFARISHDEWNREMTLARYDQAWSMVQFLLHADGGKHRDRLVQYVAALCAGKPHVDSWTAVLGDWHEFETRWKSYWLDLPDEGSADVYTEATVATLTSFLARTAAAGQTFETFSDFAVAARRGGLKVSPQDWLPPSLLVRALESVPKDARIDLTDNGTGLTARWPGGRTFTGQFKTEGGRVVEVQVTRNPEP